MNLKRLTGVFTLISAISLICLAFMIMSDPVHIEAFYLKLALFNFVASISLFGFYLVQSRDLDNKNIKLFVHVFGLILLIYGYLVSFNLVDYLSSWNLLIALGILYVMTIQLITIGLNSAKILSVKIFQILIIISNLFLALFFLLKWNFSSLSILIDIIIVISILSFLFGVVIERKRAKKAVQ